MQVAALEEISGSLAASHRRETELEEMCLAMQQQLAAEEAAKREVEASLQAAEAELVAARAAAAASSSLGPPREAWQAQLALAVMHTLTSDAPFD